MSLEGNYWEQDVKHDNERKNPRAKYKPLEQTQVWIWKKKTENEGEMYC